jgi:zinc protease
VPGSAPEPRLPAIERKRLDNGLGLVMLSSARIPLIVLELVIAAGSERDGAGRAGLADLTVHLLPEGTRELGMLEIADRLAGMGARLTVGAGYDEARIRISTLRSNLGPALDLLADLVLRPAFPPTEVERLRGERLVDLVRSADDPGTVARRAFAAELFGGDHPYGAPIEGTVPSVRALPRKGFPEFFERAYTSAGATLVAVGDFEPQVLGTAVERAFGGWEARPIEPIDVSPPDWPGRGVVLVERPGSAQSALRVGHVGVAFSHPDAVALRILNHLLGGAFPSRINLNLRERRGWTYGVRSAFDLRKGPGPFVIGTSVANDVTRAAIEEIRAEIARAALGPIEEAERSLAVNGLVLGLPLLFQTPGQIADRVREIVVHDLPDDWWNDLLARYRSVTVDDLERVARAHLDPGALLAVVVGDPAAVADDLAALGPLERRTAKPAPSSTSAAVPQG